MAEHRTAELEGELLDAAVHLAEGGKLVHTDMGLAVLVDMPLLRDEPVPCGAMRYSQEWNLAGPLIERERIGLEPLEPGRWEAYVPGEPPVRATTPLVAAMRAFVASKLGDTVTLPDGAAAQEA